MNWPGTNDPYKRKKTIKFLVITAVIGVSVAAASSILQQVVDADNPLKVCINDRNTPYKVSATLELIVDGKRHEIPANVGLSGDGDDTGYKCKRTMYTLSNDGTIYAEWEEEFSFEIGHFLWLWKFPLKDMNQDKSAIYVDGQRSPHFINHPLQEGSHYKAEFTSKAYDESKDKDFLPPEK